MREIIVQSFITLDGVMQSPGGPYEDPSGGFIYGGWAVNYFDESMMTVLREYSAKPFALLLGRRTYEIFAAHWPYVNEKHKENPQENALDDPFADALNAARKYVVSDAPLILPWNNSTPIMNHVVQEIRKLKEEDGPELQVHGSGNLIQTLLKHDLVDGFRLMIFPMTLGKGKKLFADGTQSHAFKLKKSITSSTGVIMATYERAGAVQFSTAEFETPTEAELARRKRLVQEEKERSI
jgi:dihydrofolate reductase